MNREEELRSELAAIRKEGVNAYVEEFDFREAMLTYIEMRFTCTKDPALCKECKGFT